MQGHAVHGRSHAMLAHAVVHVAPGVVRRVEHAHALDQGIVRPGEVGRAAEHLRIGGDQGGQGRAGMHAGGVRGLVRDHPGDVGLQGLARAGGDLAAHRRLEGGAVA